MVPPEDLLLLPGASVAIHATVIDNNRGIAVPASAVRIGPGNVTSVLRFVENAEGRGRLENVPVDLSVNDDGSFEVLQGLQPSDEIVASGVANLAEDQLVRRFTAID